MKYDENKEKYFSENLAKYLKEENDKLENKKKLAEKKLMEILKFGKKILIMKQGSKGKMIF